MKNSTWYLGAALVVMVLFCGALSAHAQEESGFRRFLRNVFHYPASVVKESAAVTSKTAANVTETAVKTTEAATDVATFQLDKTTSLVTTPVEGVADTTVDAVKGTVEIPAKAAEDLSQPAPALNENIK